MKPRSQIKTGESKVRNITIVVLDEKGKKLHETIVAVPAQTVDKKDVGAFMGDIADALLRGEGGKDS